jgi:hypothetical protein
MKVGQDVHIIVFMRMDTNIASSTDQACPEADPCRSAYPFQGHRRHR